MYTGVAENWWATLAIIGYFLGFLAMVIAGLYGIGEIINRRYQRKRKKALEAYNKRVQEHYRRMK